MNDTRHQTPEDLLQLALATCADTLHMEKTLGEPNPRIASAAFHAMAAEISAHFLTAAEREEVRQARLFAQDRLQGVGGHITEVPRDR